MKQLLFILAITISVKTFAQVSKSATTKKFNWVAWNKVSSEIKSKFKKIGIYNSIVENLKYECAINISILSLDYEKKEGYAVSMQGGACCGTRGCSLEIYEDNGNKVLWLIDEVEEVVPVKNGVITSKGKFMPYEYKETKNSTVSKKQKKQKLTPAAAYIFKDVKTKLSNGDKNDLADGYKIGYYDGTPQLNIIMDIDEKTHDTIATYANVSVYPTDLNKDGIEEIFMVEEDEFIKADPSHPALYIKNKGGKYVLQESWHGYTEVYVSSNRNLGYPDLISDDGGFYRWNGKKYIPNKHTNSIQTKSIDKTIIEISNAYVSSLPDSLLKNNIVFDEPKTKSSTAMEKTETSASKTSSPPNPPEINPIAASLFTDVKTKLTIPEKNEIAYLTGIKEEEINAKTKKGKPKYGLNIYPLDLNKDGTEEIFLCVTTKPLGIPMNTYFFYAKDNYGKYQASPGKIGQGVKILSNGKTGFPDLITSTALTDREVWTWNGNAYRLAQTIPAATVIPFKTINIDDASKEYSDSR